MSGGGAAEVPGSVSINAWAGEEASVSGRVGEALRWALQTALPKPPKKMLFAEKAPDLADWHDERVGWGLVLPENADLSRGDKARGADAPDPIQELLADRANAPVLRYLEGSPNRFTTLMRYTKDGKAFQPDIAGSPFGVDKDRIPYYLLIVGSPAEIPWDLQYALNTRFAVGRLDLDEASLTNYVAALRAGWANSDATQAGAVIWTTDHGGGDMSQTMRLYVAEPLWNKLDDDVLPASILVDKDHGGATTPRLLDALAAKRPGLVTTTSHGVTFPADDSAAMASNLGLLFGEDRTFAQPEDVLARWKPDGAIWYAHACCSAGCRGDTIFDDLVDGDSSVGKLLRDVAKLGSLTAPLPKALLGAKRPLRAFVGHVEPTFDWSIRQPDTRQGLAAGITTALWDSLFLKESCPIGHAFRKFYEPIGALATQRVSLTDDLNKGGEVTAQLLQVQLRSRDIASTVILGDPTVQLDFS
jgi:hypothetical protein